MSYPFRQNLMLKCPDPWMYQYHRARSGGDLSRPYEHDFAREPTTLGKAKHSKACLSVDVTSLAYHATQPLRARCVWGPCRCLPGFASLMTRGGRRGDHTGSRGTTSNARRRLLSARCAVPDLPQACKRAQDLRIDYFSWACLKRLPVLVLFLSLGFFLMCRSCRCGCQCATLPDWCRQF